MEFATGVIVRVSLPLAVPERPMPNVYVLLLMDILVGVALERVAVPPEIAKAKSLACKAPLPPLVLYTLSENVTATVALPTGISAANVMVGASLSFRFTADVISWDVSATLPSAS